MANYDFSTLNATDLEELARDLLNDAQPENSSIRYRTYKEGKDKGVDLLYSTPGCDYDHVGQVKHYYRSGYAAMLRDLKNKEVDKVKALMPKKYLFLTSVDLSHQNAQEIKDVFEPFIKSLSDVYGKNDLNALIDENPSILERHYKLWLNDLSIIQMVLGSPLQFRSSIMLEHELKKRLRIYVRTSIFEKIRTSLAEKKYVVITGEPGVGKTTLAEMLAYEYIARGYKMSFVINAREAEEAIVKDDSKQIIYFDDFLGSTAVEINKARGSEMQLVNILRLIKHLENKFLIFTTRTYLFNTALQQSERLRQFGIKANSSMFELTEYGPELRKQLYINHIEEANLDEERERILLDPNLVDFIIYHDHFKPRAIEYLTDREKLLTISTEGLREYILKNFKILDEIWLHAYSEQINDEDRILLSTIITFGDGVGVKTLETAYLNRLEYEAKHNNRVIGFNQFEKSMERLTGDFIFIDKYQVAQLINPSLIDFLVKHIRNDSNEVNRIVKSVTFAAQLTERLYSLTNWNLAPMPKELQQRVLHSYKNFIDPNRADYDRIQMAMVINRFVEEKEKFDVISDIIDEITDFEALRSDYSLNLSFREFISAMSSHPEISQQLEERVMEIVNDLVTGETDIEQAIEVLEELVNDFDIDLGFVDSDLLVSHFESIFNDHIANEIDYLHDYITDEGEAFDKQGEIKKMIDKVEHLGLELQTDINDFNIDWYDVAWENELRRIMEKDD